MIYRSIHLIRLFAVFGCGIVGTSLMAAEPSDVLLPTKRAEILERAAKLQTAQDLPTVIPNPFYPEGFLGAQAPVVQAVAGAPVVAAVVGPRSAQQILEAIATNLQPSGYFVIGGQQTLVFGQKRIKAGGTMTVTFEGTDYNLEITAIDRTNFTLRLNNETFTRPIK